MLLSLCAFHVQTAQGFTFGLFTSKVSTRVISHHKFPTFLKTTDSADDLEETTKKFGLEAGLWKAFTSKNSDQPTKPGDLLKKYGKYVYVRYWIEQYLISKYAKPNLGAAYLITSISLAIVSYGLCYLLVSNGVDVGVLLEKIGIKASSAASNAGTGAIAYAIHKAASPIRFPPTVALTPVVANWIGKKTTEDTQ